LWAFPELCGLQWRRQMVSDASSGRSAMTERHAKKHSPLVLAVFAMLLTATMVCVAGMLTGVFSALPSHHDTQWFWASGRLLTHGANPYDREAVRQMELALGLPVKGPDVPMLRNPPTALFLLVPMGLLGPRAAVLAWSLMLAICLAVSVLAVRAMMENPYERGYLLLAWFFPPALLCIEMGQTGLLTLAGLALFLRFHESRPLWAGAALSLCAIKPHLLLPFGVALLAWMITRKKWAILCGALLALTAESVVAMAFDHAVWRHYLMAMRAERIVDEFVPTFGVALRFLVSRTAMWVEFIPAALGCVWAVWYYQRNRDSWSWRTHGSVLTLVSLVVAPYAWLTDQVLVIPAILFALTGLRRPARGSVTLLMAVLTLTAAQMMSKATTLYFKPDMALGLVWLAWYLYATSRTTTKKAVAAGGESAVSVPAL
jgi:hypothetical protein